MITPVEVILMIVVLYQGVSNYLERREYKKERSEFINKIMSRNYQEYAGSAYMENYKMPPNMAPMNDEELMEEREYRSQTMGIPVT